MTFRVDSALQLVQAAVRIGSERQMPIAVVVVDGGGRPLASARSQDAGYINLTIAERKAVAAVNFKVPTHAVLQMIKEDSLLLGAVTSESSISILPGGLPIVVGGVVVGAIGIAGGHYSHDQAVGEEVLKTLGPKGS